jgi:hypothetical protein
MLNLDESTKQTIKKITNDGGLSVSTKSNNRRYAYHSENDVLVEFSEEVENLLPGYLMESITNAYIDVYMEICSNLEKQGYECYNVAENDVVEFANENEYQYFANGDIYHG